MKKYEKICTWFVGVILAILIFNYLDCKCSAPKEIVKIDTIYKTEYKENLIIDTSFVPKWITVKEKIYISDTVYRIDTIIKYVTNHLTKNVYKDTILNDTSGLIIITDTIYKNLIKYRKSDISLYNKTVIKQPKNNALFIGFGSQLNQKVNMSFGLKYKHKKNMFGANYSTNNIISFEYYYLLK